MKKVLLLSGVLGGLSASSQTFTVDDTLYTGLTTAYYVMDSTAANLSAVTGTGVTWNYANLTAYENATTPDVIIDASASPFASSFPNSVYNDDLSTGASIFFSNSPDSMTVQGYVFVADGNDVIVKHDLNPLKMMTFPLAVGGTYTDDLSGEVEIMGNPFPSTGTATITVDGFGTLNVSGNTHTNILRVKLVEVIDAAITVPFPVSGTVTRTVYSYYDMANDKQAIFVHATLDIDSDLLVDNYTAVYYSPTPNYFMGTEDMVNTNFSVYPNPAANNVTITTDGTVESIVIMNTLGQPVLTITAPQQTETINTEEFTSGIYIVQINQEGVLTEQKLIIE